MSYPKDLRYTKEHEWLGASGGRWRVGVTQFAVDQLGDITLVELPAEGDLVTRGQVFGTVESVKSVSDLFAPISGKVTAINPVVKDSPELVNSDPYGAGWMIEIEPTEASEMDELMDQAQYAQFTTAEPA